MKKALSIVAVLALASTAWATVTLDAADMAAPQLAGNVSINGGVRADVVYSNTATVTAAYSRAWPPASEIGDELYLTAGGVLDTLAFSVYNSSSSAGVLQTADLTLKFYNYNVDLGTYDLAGTIGYDNVDFGTNGLPIGYYTTFAVGGLASANILLTDDVLATLTIDDLTGGSNRVGQVLANPPTVGASDDNFYRDGSWYYFGGNPVANFYWEIGVVPEPATLALLALGGLTVLRRRR